MKRCPTCQKVFEDDKKFCQVDGTPLDDAVESVTPDDPFKTVIGVPPITATESPIDDKKTFVISAEEKDDLLQLPETFDPMKTVVVSEPIKPPPPPINEPVVSSPEPPKFSEPSLSPPSFGDLSASEPPKLQEPPKIESPFSNPMNEPQKMDTPIANPFNTPPPPIVESPKFEATPLPSESSKDEVPFNKPVSSPFDTPSPFKESEPMFSNEQPKPSSPFDTPATPFGQSSDPFANQQQDSAWSPPPAPVQSWQDNSIGQNTPFQPPPTGTGGQNQTMGIVTLVLGIVSLLCLGFLAGIPALITGFMTMKNVKNDPAQYGGKVMAIIGMILSALGILWSVLYLVFVIIALLGSVR